MGTISTNKKITILLTGGNGMVGRNLLEHPSASKFNFIAPRSKDLNLLNFNEIIRFIEYNQPDLLIHAAGRVGGIQANIREPSKFFLENLDIGRNVVWAARQIGVKKLINLGSSCMYPANNNNNLKEEFILGGPLEQTNEGYALAKISITRLCEYISREDNYYQYKTLIPCNIYGKYDKFDPEFSHLLPAVIYKIHFAKQNRLKSVEIWGDGQARREFMYAGDFADALIKSIEKFDTLPYLMNVGLGYDYSICEYYETVAEVLGYFGSFHYNIKKPVGMKRKVVDVTRLRQWGWTHSNDLKLGIKKTYDYYLNEIKHEL